MRRSPTICASVAIVKRILQVELGYKHKKIPADKSIKAYLSGDEYKYVFRSDYRNKLFFRSADFFHGHQPVFCLIPIAQRQHDHTFQPFLS
jgi:hypothetical protein